MIENVAIERWQTKMWQLKTNDQKHDNRKLWRPKHVAIKMCCDQNSWQWILWQLKTCDDRNVWRPNSFDNWNFNDQIPGEIKRHFNRHKVYNDQIGSNFCCS
jgi:hypothetical protein